MLVYDGQRGYGQVVARNATNIAIDTAREQGVAVLALRNSYHVGRIGAYGEQCAAKGMVSVHFVNATGHQPRVAPFGGRDARLPTNPFCVAIPASDRHRSVVLDMATSRIAQGKVRVARNSGLQVPEGCLLDSKGEPTTEPAVMFDSPPGALLPVRRTQGLCARSCVRAARRCVGRRPDDSAGQRARTRRHQSHADDCIRPDAAERHQPYAARDGRAHRLCAGLASDLA